MLSEDKNDRLTRVGPGTPGGNWFRRFWLPVAAIPEFTQEPVLPVKVLGEELVAFRGENGAYGLLSQRCAHRGMSLVYGIPEAQGLRCSYHGWLFDNTGKCRERPFERESAPPERANILSYPVQEMGGLLWAYLGPSPVPLLPRLDVYVMDNVGREIGIATMPCNWLQITESGLDPVHTEHLHTRHLNYVRRRSGKPPLFDLRPHLEIDFEVFEYGIYKRRLVEGQSPDSPDWKIGHPLIFPSTLRSSDGPGHAVQISVPHDDVTTRYYYYHVYPHSTSRGPVPPIKMHELVLRDERGGMIVDKVLNQDFTAWISQGPIANRTNQLLGRSDRGIVTYLKLLDEEIAKVERGEDPLGVIRDPAKNVVVEIKTEAKDGRAQEFSEELQSKQGTDYLLVARREVPTTTE